MCPRCLVTIRTFRGIPHNSRLDPRTFPGLSVDNTQTFMVLSWESINRTLFPRLMRIVRRNGIIHFGNTSCSCLCSSGHQALDVILVASAVHHTKYCDTDVLHFILTHKYVINSVNPLTTGNAGMCTQHCSYWCPGAKTPGHQYPQLVPATKCSLCWTSLIHKYYI